jgi:peroxiredoxin
MSLQDKLDAFKADFKAGKPPYNAPAEIHPIMERATAELIANGQASRAIKAGDRAPVFTLNDQDGNAVSSADLIAQGPLVVTFYRGVWCPYCNLELQAINEVLPQIQAYGGNVLAISPQTQVNSRKSVRSNALGFPVLSDVRGAVAADFGLRFALPDYLVELYKNLKNDLPAFNDDPSWTLPMPARYVIGQDGVVLYSEVNPDYTHRPDPTEMFAVLEQAQVEAKSKAQLKR